MKYEAVIGLEVHAELQTRSKMFCACPIVDAASSQPNSAVCPVCAGLPGVLPVVNKGAVELGLRVALALECQIAHTSLFARKNYFYPDLPKGYQISQYEYPLAQHGRLAIDTPGGEKIVRIRRVHLEEDTGKLTHVREQSGEDYSLVDLNRAGVPLLEIVSEPDLHSIEETRLYAKSLRTILRYAGASSGDMEKGAVRFEANVSLRLTGSQELGTRVEIKNLNSFRAMERAIAFEIDRQTERLERGELVDQETLGWSETDGCTYSQRSKEEAHDYRYFPEPDLPPLVVESEWLEQIKAELPELPREKQLRLQREYGLTTSVVKILSAERALANYFEQTVRASEGKVPVKTVANWISGELFAWLNQSGQSIEQIRVTPEALAGLIARSAVREINLKTAKTVLAQMLQTGQSAGEIIQAGGLQQVSDAKTISGLVKNTLNENAAQIENYLAGKTTLFEWFFGQAMRASRGAADPQVLREELKRQLAALKR